MATSRFTIIEQIFVDFFHMLEQFPFNISGRELDCYHQKMKTEDLRLKT